MNFRYRFG